MMLLLPVCLATACSSGTPTLTPATSIVPAVDASFITGAAQASNSEINAAHLAIARSSNTDVIAFAQKMITDHTAENNALDPIGNALGDPPPTNVNATQASVAAQLNMTVEPAFDGLYINSEIAGHTMNLDDNYIPELANGVNPQVKGYASTYQPQVQSHLTLAQSIKQKYGF